MSIAYAYDALGRLSSRTVSGEGAESFGYDALGRLSSHGSDLGSFTLSYLGETSQIAERALTGATLSTSWSYLPNSGDRRLSGITDVGLASGQTSTFTYTSNALGWIGSVTESADTGTVYPASLQQESVANGLNQVVRRNGQPLAYDADGELLSDGQRTYSWDAAGRLIGIGYPAAPGKATSFAYDGLGRRVAITSTPAGGGGSTATTYVWCGSRLCQARDGSGDVTREYLAEGEYVPGSPGQAYYYGVDQIGSVRRVFESTTTAPAYAYDPYGNPLQGTAPETDFGYAGLFYEAGSGLDLAGARAYDPVAGRWLSRDPLGEGTDPQGNLYAYVGGNPISLADPSGLISQGEAAALIALTEVIGGGPEDPVADIVSADIEESALADAAATEEGEAECVAAETAGAAATEGTVTVGRFMSPNELSAMQETGLVQESFNNGVTSVTLPPNPGGYRAAPSGDVFVQFDVPESAIGAGPGSAGVAKIYGPNSIFGPRLGITQMPPAFNITVPGQ